MSPEMMKEEQKARTDDAEPADLQIVRGQYFYRDHIPRLTLVNDMLSFSNKCVELLDAEYVNILISSESKTVRIRKCAPYDMNSVRWFNLKKGIRRARKIKSRMLTAQFFNDLGFDYDHKYRLEGEYRTGTVDELIFFADTPEVFVLEKNGEKESYVRKFHDDWRGSYGIPVREHTDHKLHTFENYTVLDITLEKVVNAEDASADPDEVARMNELTSKYIREDGYRG